MIWLPYHLLVLAVFVTGLIKITLPWYFYLLSLLIALFLFYLDWNKMTKQGQVKPLTILYMFQNVATMGFCIWKLVNFHELFPIIAIGVIATALFQALLNLGVIRL